MTDLRLQSSPCPACAADPHSPGPRVAGEPPAPPGPWSYVRCDACASDYLRPRPADPTALYGDDYHVHQPRGTAAIVTRAMAWLEALRLQRWVDADGEVLEIGCGRGDVLAALRDRGLRVSGIEPSLAAVAAAADRGLAVEQGALEDRRGVDGSLDLVFAAHVLEHVAAPALLFREARRLLRPGGIAIFKTPLAGSWDAAVLGPHSTVYDAPFHLLVPSRRALEDLARDAGLELRAIVADPVPNDWVHGLRRAIAARTGLRLGFVHPVNPLLSLALLPLSLAAAGCGAAGRARLILRKS